MSELLSIDDLRVDFDAERHDSAALRGISLDVAVGEILGVVGETGCGKTLTGLAVLGCCPTNAHVSGSIRFDGIELTDFPTPSSASLRGRADQHGLPEPGQRASTRSSPSATSCAGCTWHLPFGAEARGAP